MKKEKSEARIHTVNFSNLSKHGPSQHPSMVYLRPSMILHSSLSIVAESALATLPHAATPCLAFTIVAGLFDNGPPAPRRLVFPTPLVLRAALRTHGATSPGFQE